MNCLHHCQTQPCANELHYYTAQEIAEMTAWCHEVLDSPLACHNMIEMAQEWLQTIKRNQK